MASFICLGLISTVSAMMWIGPRITAAMGEDLARSRSPRPPQRARHSGGRDPGAVRHRGFAAAHGDLPDGGQLHPVQPHPLFDSHGAGRLRPALAAAGSAAPVPHLGIPGHAGDFSGVSVWMLVHMLSDPRPGHRRFGVWRRWRSVWPFIFSPQKRAPHPSDFRHETLRPFSVDAPGRAPPLRNSPLLSTTPRSFSPVCRSKARWSRSPKPTPGEITPTLWTKAWFKKEYFQLAPIRAWMTTNASEYYNSSNTMYYMFSGPDFLYAHAFFPNANTYILAGLEPVGQVPDLSRLSPDVLGGELSALRSSMSTDSARPIISSPRTCAPTSAAVGGTLPILYVFLARRGCTVLDTTYINSPAPGVKITFVQSEGPKQTLYYFKTDLSGGKSTFLSWCAAQGPGLSLLKAASYLMHGEGFAGVRNFLLERSRVIIQDDSGIPLRSFPKGWKSIATGVMCRTRRCSGNIISPISPRFMPRTRRPPNSDSPSAITGRRIAASL